jgi:tyrosyl-tRNA synthetase
MTSSTTSIEQIFVQQAEFLCRIGEFLPGGVEALAQKLQQAAHTQIPLKVKLGLDPTRPDLHLGHTVVLRKLKAFQELGHEVILIIGDATAMIGDPSGRSETRPPLTNEEVMVNAETYLEQASKVINVSKTKVVRNSEWLSPLNLEALLKLASNVTVAQMMVRDDFAKRYESGKPISIHEFFYPLMQAYDSVVIDADIELGGTDQRFNTLLGRDIQLAYGKTNPQSVLLLPLIEGTDGKIKMSKSYPDHCVNLTDLPQEMFGKIMSIPDHLILRYAELLTTIMANSLNQLKTQIETGAVNPRDIKAELAKWIIGEYYSREDAVAAEEAFVKQFKHNEVPEDIEEALLNGDQHYHLPTLIAEHKLAPSKTEARRLILGGGVKLNRQKVSDADYEFSGRAGQEMVLQVGRRRFVKLIFQSVN